MTYVLKLKFFWKGALMKKIDDKKLLESYLAQYNIRDFFSVNLDEYMELHSFKKGEHICEQGELLKYFYFFVMGKGKVYTFLENGRSLLLRFYEPLQMISDVEFMEKGTADCSIQIIEDAICIAIPTEIIKKYALEDNVFLRNLCKSLSQKLSSYSVASSINLLYPLEDRLASYMLSYLYYEDEEIYPKVKVENITHLGELLGASYRHLSRVIGKLVNKGIIKREGKMFVILDRESLEDMAGDLYK